jgi:hypothetical protein
MLNADYLHTYQDMMQRYLRDRLNYLQIKADAAKFMQVEMQQAEEENIHCNTTQVAVHLQNATQYSLQMHNSMLRLDRVEEKKNQYVLDLTNWYKESMCGVLEEVVRDPQKFQSNITTIVRDLNLELSNVETAMTARNAGDSSMYDRYTTHDLVDRNIVDQRIREIEHQQQQQDAMRQQQQARV